MSRNVQEDSCNICLSGEEFTQWKCVKCTFWAHPYCWVQMVMNVFHLSTPQEYIAPTLEPYRWQERSIVKCPHCKTSQSWVQLSTLREVEVRTSCIPCIPRAKCLSFQDIQNHRGRPPSSFKSVVCAYCYEPFGSTSNHYGCNTHPMHHVCAGIVYGFGFLRPFCPWCGPLRIPWLTDLDKLAKEWLDLMTFAQSVTGYAIAYDTMYHIREDDTTSNLMATNEFAMMFFQRYASVLQRIDALLDAVLIEEVIYVCGLTTINYLCYRIHYLIQSNRQYAYTCFKTPEYQEIRIFRAKWRTRVHEYCDANPVILKYRNRVKVAKNYPGMIVPGSLTNVAWR